MAKNLEKRIATLTEELKIQLKNEKNQGDIEQVENIEGDNKLEVWSEPENLLGDSDLLPVQKFDTAMLPNGFAEMVEDTSCRMQVPPEFIAVPLMVGLSSLLAGKIYMYPKQHDSGWVVVCNLWGAAIGSPSLLKTPCIKKATQPLRQLQRRANETYEKELNEYECQRKVDEEQERLERESFRKVLKYEDENQRAVETEEYKDFWRNAKESPAKKRYIIGDSTTEKTQEIQIENKGRCLMLLRDELSGLLFKLDERGKENDRTYLLEAWAGDTDFNNDTIGRGSKYVPDNMLAICGTSQPAPWRNFLNDTINSTHKDNGFPQRFQLAVYPDEQKNWEYIDDEPDTVALERVHEAFEHIDNLDPSEIGACAGDDGKHYLKFAPDAQIIFKNWMVKHEKWLRNDDNLPSYLKSHFAKYRSLVPSIALIIHIANKNTGAVDVESTIKAVKWIEYLTPHAKRIYGNILSAEEQTAQLIAKKLLNWDLPGEFTVRELYTKHWSGISKDTAEEGLKVLQDANWGILYNKSMGNKPSMAFIVNPKIYK